MADALDRFSFQMTAARMAEPDDLVEGFRKAVVKLGVHATEELAAFYWKKALVTF